MDSKQREELRAQIVREINVIQNEHLSGAEYQTQATADQFDMAQDMVNKSVSDSLRNKSKARLQAMKKALHRIDNDPDYGHCEGCGEEVPFARMKAVPTATHCVECMERAGR